MIGSIELLPEYLFVGLSYFINTALIGEKYVSFLLYIQSVFALALNSSLHVRLVRLSNNSTESNGALIHLKKL